MAFLDSFDGFIFDYGKVLVTDQTAAERAQMARILSLSPEVFEELYWRDRLDYDKGLLNAITYWQALAKSANREITPSQIEAVTEIDSVSWMHFDETMWAFVEELKKQGKRVAMLSNMPSDLGETIKQRSKRLDVFHYVTLSYEINSVKPEPAIYEHCLRGIGTAASKTIFFDDKIVNVRGAEMVGLHAVEFLDRDAVLKKLRS